LPSARSQGEPLRLMLDLDDKTEFVSAFPYRPGASRILASSGGYGFVVKEEDLLANRKAGKQVLNVEGDKALICIPADGDQVAVLGDNGKALIFPLEELPHMARAKGVRLQSYREGGLRDLMVFHAAAGAAWTDAAGRIREWPQWREWIGRRASAGRLAPRGFPASRRFRPR
jgi:topoisomerase-4 subunit A